MTNPNISSNDPYDGEFTAPQDQLTTEMQLLDKYKGSDLEAPMNRNLNLLKKIAGISIPDLKDPKIISLADPNSEPSDHYTKDEGGGFVAFCSTIGPSGYSYVSLGNKLPDLTQEAFESMSQVQQSEYLSVRYGLAVAGPDFPMPVKNMLSDLYSLVGAKTVRTDPANNAANLANRLRKGEYMGTTFYIQEQHVAFAAGDEKYAIHSVRFMGEETGRSAEVALSEADYERARQEVGIPGWQLRQDLVDKTTLDAYLQHIRDINELG